MTLIHIGKYNKSAAKAPQLVKRAAWSQRIVVDFDYVKTVSYWSGASIDGSLCGARVSLKTERGDFSMNEPLKMDEFQKLLVAGKENDALFSAFRKLMEVKDTQLVARSVKGGPKPLGIWSGWSL
jgi:hypothetical protein